MVYPLHEKKPYSTHTDVIPAKAGTHKTVVLFQSSKSDPRLHGDDTGEKKKKASPCLMSIKFFLIGLMSITLGGCSSFSDPEIIMRANSEKRKPKPHHMPPEEKPIEAQKTEKHIPPLAPQVGVRIPLGK